MGMNTDKNTFSEERRKVLKRIVERVKDTLLSSNKNFVVLQFPPRYKERSIDIVAIDEEGQNLIIRVKPLPTLGKDEVEDLVRASLAFDAVPIMVAHSNEIYDNIVYEKESIYILNERTFENLCLRPSELVALYRKGDLYLKLNSENFKRIKELRKYSLSDLSYKTGISRRTLFSYEREDSMISIEAAEKLVDILGEDVVRTIDLKIISKEFRKRISKYRRVQEYNEEIINNKLKLLIKSKGINVKSIYPLKKSAPDYIIEESEEGNVKAVVDATTNRYTLKEVVKKIIESIKIANLVKGETNIIVSNEISKAITDELSTQISSNKYEIVKIR